MRYLRIHHDGSQEAIDATSEEISRAMERGEKFALPQMQEPPSPRNIEAWLETIARKRITPE